MEHHQSGKAVRLTRKLRSEVGIGLARPNHELTPPKDGFWIERYYQLRLKRWETAQRFEERWGMEDVFCLTALMRRWPKFVKGYSPEDSDGGCSGEESSGKEKILWKYR
ncbi:hypothetical protein BJ508DRAFT_34638 [Ascobolus immersus RN42]|uniref:Uncharacterized protein n=1 Tax=Ascobolus immersus RN42 TaxID=1160509 RepID=A0A3N4HL50_ASCIM|nr:hypothetical protein BJ508DRAFT_34638 [Ascobolus immersus RN42]